ncbi:MAG TPA: glycosyltransferase, partial [Ohtaekwangia sp.]
MKQNPGNRSCCAHYASRYLPLTENWIYRLIINHQQYKPIFLSRKKENLSRFPMTDLYSLDDFGLVRQYLELFYFKITGYFPFQLRACDQNHVELLHVHFGYHGAKLIGLKKRLSIPMVCSFYGDDAFASMHAGKYDTLFKVADKILVLGPYMKSELIRLGCTEDKLLIHHLGIDVDKLKFVKRTVKKGSRLRFLIASSFLPKKGVDLAIEALSACKDEFDFSVDVIGDGPLKTEILKRIEAGGMQNRVTLHGYQSYEYFINLAYQCDVFIQA